jgi:hypothetical protein
MHSYELIISPEKSLNLRLTSRSTVALEQKLGMSPISALMENQQVPKLETAITILHGCAQALNHGVTQEKVYDLYDEYVDCGGTLMDLIMCLVEVFKISGFFKEAPAAEAQEPAQEAAQE